MFLLPKLDLGLDVTSPKPLQRLGQRNAIQRASSFLESCEPSDDLSGEFSAAGTKAEKLSTLFLA